ncbi:MAG TPA: 3'-5' exonuclease [Dyella sp.]|uniref:3'-5' exonuclease n=1 Tax=Dyella sp. TaxID=1869338 RepID=UPI002D76D480|nr:3'-5' exonuclease [Dyella sp.]HET6555094.1 3'-5' exonuclease [Dyella sp.]
MATLIPSRNSGLSRMTSGEKRVSERLEQKLEDDYLVWYDVPVGPRQRQPDFIVFHPRRGLLVLEVKDWKPGTIQQADRTLFTLLTGSSSVKEHNPLMQARDCANEIHKELARDPALVYPPGHAYAGRLQMPLGHGVVLANISRKQFDAGELDGVLPSHLVICQDEMYESVEAEALQERLWAMFPQIFPTTLTLPQIDRVRWHLFPEIRVEAGEGQFGLFASQEKAAGAKVAIPDLIKVMDAQQEMLARSLGDEHRIIHGVAGSGKTMILGFRAMELARSLSKPILVLCYNKTLAARLEQLMGERGLSDKVQVYNFHTWCRSMLTAYHVPLPAEGPHEAEELPPAVIAGVDGGQIPRFQYGAVLVDEGHDFEPEWYRLIVQMIDPNTNSLLVLYDDAQNIYGQASRKRISWKSLGVQAQGRTTILKLNYRNTLEILSVARGFAQELLVERREDEDSVPLIAPQSSGRRGALPELIRVEQQEDQLPAIIQRLRDEHAHGRRLSDMAVIFRNSWEGEKLHEALQRAGIPSRLAEGNGSRALFVVDDTVKLVTMHASKGLEFPLVIIPGLGSLPKPGKSEADEARLLYVAMTRATERLVLIHHEDSIFSQRIRHSINDVQDQLTAAIA